MTAAPPEPADGNRSSDGTVRADPSADAPSPGPGTSPRERRRRSGGDAKHRAKGPADAWLERLLFLVVVGSVLAVGTVHVQALLAIGTLATATGVLAVVVYRRKTGAWPVSLPAAGILALTAWTALQAIPLPARLVAKIAPSNADVWAHALDPLSEPGPGWHSISLDPGATWVEVLKGVTYLSLLVAASVIASRRGAGFGVATVFVSALAAGVLTVMHGLTGLTKVFGIYKPIYFSGAWNMGPLLNSNHLAGYLNLGAMCGLGLMLRRETKVPRGVLGLGVATLFALTLTSGSRGAVVMVPVGVGLVVALLWRQGHQRDGRSVSLKWLNLLALGAMAGGFGLAALGITTSQWKSLVDNDLSKLMIVRWAEPLVLDHPLLGIGRGAFETVYPAYRPIAGNILWTHPENLLVQWAAEWGIPVALIAAVFFGWLLRPSRLGATQSAVAAGALAGVIVLVLQNFVDFSLELPSVAGAVVVLIGSVWADTGRRGVRRWHRDSKVGAESALWRKVGVAVALGIAGMAATGLAWTKGIPTPLMDRMAFQELGKRSPLPKQEFDSLIRGAMLRHPGEPYLPLVGAERAARVGDENPVKYLERVLSRARIYGRAHLLLAQILLRRDLVPQGLMELKFACRDEPALAARAVEVAVRSTQDYDDLVRMVPEGIEGAKVMDALGTKLHQRAPDVGRRFDDAALVKDPSLTGPRLRRVNDVITALRDPKGQRCRSDEQRRACLELVEQEAAWVQEARPDVSLAAQLRADALVAVGRADQAASLLATACDQANDRLACLKARANVLAGLRREDEVAEVLDQIASAGCTNTSNCAQTWSWIGAFSSGHGNLGAALNAYRRAASYDSDDAGVWVKVGDAAEALNLHAQAAQAYERASKLGPPNDALRKKADAAKAKALQSLPVPGSKGVGD